MSLRRELIPFPNNGAERKKQALASAVPEENKLSGMAWVRLYFFGQSLAQHVLRS